MELTRHAQTGYFGSDIAEGDVIYCNDPAFLGSHLPDMVMYKPVFYEGEVVFWAANKSHMMDTGGPVAGGYNPHAKDIFAEGIRISPIKLYERGRLRNDVMDLLLTNVRIPGALRGDMRAQYAAVSTAETRLLALLDRYGRETMRLCCEALLDRAERIMREQIALMPNGSYEGSATLEDYGHGQGEAEVRARVEIRDTDVHVALEAPPQADSYFNAYWPNTQSMVYFALLAAIDVDLPHNEGLYRPVSIDFGPAGSRVNAQIPAACAQATGTMAELVWDAVADAFSKAVPTRACAGWSRPFLAIFAGVDPRTGDPWADYSLAGGMGGGGAVHGMNGWDAIGWVNAAGACHHGEVELMEHKEPIRLWRHELRADSACPGTWRGGFGTVHEVELLAPITLTTISDGVVHPPPSRLQAASVHDELKVHKKWLTVEGTTEVLLPQSVLDVPAGSRVLSHSSGGGAVGSAFARDPNAVLEDVSNELVSIECALEEYGVVIDSDTLEIDAKATIERRAAS